MWLSQRFQGMTSALTPLYSLSSLLAGPAVAITRVQYIEAISVQRAYTVSLRSLRAMASRNASLIGVG